MRASRVRKPAFLSRCRSSMLYSTSARAMPEAQRAGLAGDAAAGNRREHIELVGGFGDGERLLDLGAERFGGEGLFERLVIDDHAAVAGPEKHAGGGCLATPGAVVLNACCHVYTTSRLVVFTALRFLRRVRMIATRVYLQLAPHGFAHLRLGQHAAHRFFNEPHRILLADVLGALLAQAPFVPAVIPVKLLFFLAARQPDLGRVDDDDMIARVDVRRVHRLVLSLEQAGRFGRHPAEHHAPRHR